jgi:hypothetical protein
MFASFAEKGKIYTNVVTKTPIDVIIQTPSHQIHGKVHVRPNGRLKDELTSAEAFLAVTDAEVYDMNGKLAFRTQFIALHRDHINWLIPVDELMDTESTE